VTDINNTGTRYNFGDSVVNDYLLYIISLYLSIICLYCILHNEVPVFALLFDCLSLRLG